MSSPMSDKILTWNCWKSNSAAGVFLFIVIYAFALCCSAVWLLVAKYMPLMWNSNLMLLQRQRRWAGRDRTMPTRHRECQAKGAWAQDEASSHWKCFDPCQVCRLTVFETFLPWPPKFPSFTASNVFFAPSFLAILFRISSWFSLLWCCHVPIPSQHGFDSMREVLKDSFCGNYCMTDSECALQIGIRIFGN